ncbi:pyridine nucleotide-disulfide oxidoreductase [Stagnimonas aquatica]|uniref:Pyridine nucleotide-disulfide oxidoreductase n=1 Tax=Stagnimonas aquatica TaxID=2689987 RepID=A0A3N0VNB8_9GAMM|nr:FAD-dependent oxidoreductase [Stagnimonas aquatica]ROH93478.1 pyridine nucleotide-disulfide oxidoreductase [Stagnimonas aquatica]
MSDTDSSSTAGSTPESVFVIVGAGQAGGEVSGELRKQGYTGRVLLIGEEEQIPYKRPPLSKGFLAGSVTEESLYVSPRAKLEQLNIEFLGATRVSRIDRARRVVVLADGREQRYDKLALTTGGRARLLSLTGADKPNVLPLRSIADVKKLQPLCVAGKRAVVIGGGFIGLETAAVMLKLGLHVTVLEGLPRVLARVTAPEVSSFFERMHREAGVDLRTGVQISHLEGEAQVETVVLTDGSRIAADFIIVGIGVVPNTELAAEAGLELDNGIVVDQHARTSDPDIVAAGDCSNHPSNFAGRRIRLESVQNAMEQGRIAARSMLGKDEAYQNVPWFWSDQYDLKLQMVGLSQGYDQLVLRGDPATQRNFAAFYLKAGKLIAADTVSRPGEFMLAKKWVAEGAVLPPAALADDSQPLKNLQTAA